MCVARAPFPTFSLVAPNENTHAEGDGGSALPFGAGLSGHEKVRYQRVYESSEFDFLTKAVDFFGPSFRPHSIDGSSFPPTSIPGVQIYLSTTSHSEDALSSSFSDNVGADQEFVFSGDLVLSSAANGSGPHEFDIAVDLQSPFIYSPGDGNLLLEVRIPAGAATTYFDAVDAFEAGVSRMASLVSSEDPTAGLADTWGLATQFHLAYVPEPDARLALGVCLALVLGLARLTARRRRHD